VAQPQEIENEQLGAAEELTEQQLDDVVGGNGTGATRSPAARQRQPSCIITQQDGSPELSLCS
jgi:hypothetical protein